MKRGLLRLLARTGRRLESAFGPFEPVRAGPPVIEVYLGYATPDHWIARGRVLSRLKRPQARHGQGPWRNLLQMLSLFLTDEVAEVTVTAPAHGVSAITDEEGYFNLLIPQSDARGWAEVAVEAEGAHARLPVQIPNPRARMAVVSDIDDTVIATGAWNLPRNLWTTLTGNIQSRHVFPDAVELLARLSEAGRNPVFFVSSSPWNLHAFLEGLFARAGLVRAPLFLRDLGIGELQEGPTSHGEHKGGVIDRLMAANPGLPFWLVGDTGQHDAAIYAAVAARHPGRVRRVTLRRAGRAAEAGAVAELRAQGIPVDLLDDYGPLLSELAEKKRELRATAP
ncbi:phosphatase domain-containing protein [Rubellimicrobium roseum]|nr:phosphatase domain-containing protein [Rubellimicrobium roseum]